MIKKILLIVLVILPALFLSGLIARYGVNLIYWDEWEFATLFQSIGQGHFSFQGLAAQQVESRMLFPRLVVFALAFFTHWNVRYEMFFSFFLLCIVALNIYVLARSTIAGKGIVAGLLAAMSSLLIFSPIQSYNVLTGHQMCVFFPIACLTTSIVIMYAKRPRFSVRLFCAALLCTIGTFSFSNAIINWVVLLPLIVISGLQGGESRRRIRLYAFLWIACFLTNVFFYYHNYAMPPHDAAPAFSDIFISPLASAQYYCALIGSPVSYSDLAGTVTAGFVIIFLWIIVTALFVKRCARDIRELYRLAGWFTIGAYALVSAGLITMGRIGWSIHNPLPPTRYTSFVLYCAVSLFFSAAVCLGSPVMKGVSWINTRSVRRIAAALLILFILGQVKTYEAGIGEMKMMKIDRLKGKASLLLMNIVKNGKDLNAYVYPNMDIKKETVNFLDLRGFIDPPLLKSGQISSIAQVAGIGQGADHGYFSTLKKSGNDTYTLSGWATLPDKKRPADAVLVTYRVASGDARILGASCDLGRSREYKNPFYVSAVWEMTIDRSKLPNGSAIIQAWALDAERGKAYLLHNDRVFRAGQ